MSPYPAHLLLLYTPVYTTLRCQAIRARRNQRSQDFANRKLFSYQNGIPRRTYVSVKPISVPQFQSEGTEQKQSQLRADKLIHNITNRCLRAHRESGGRPNQEINALNSCVRGKFANIFYRKRKKKSNQKVSQKVKCRINVIYVERTGHI